MIFPTPPAAGTVKCEEIGLPSEDIPLTTTCTSLPCSEKVTVCSFDGIPVWYLVLAEFSFHVPTKGSAAINAAVNANRTNRSLAYRMVNLLWGAIVSHDASGSSTIAHRQGWLKPGIDVAGFIRFGSARK